MLLELFNEVSDHGKIKVTKHGRVRYLDIGTLEGVLRLGIDEEARARKNTIFPYVAVHLNKPLKELKMGIVIDLMRKLSEIPGFRWINERMGVSKPWIWSRIEDIIREENPDFSRTKESLRRWIFEYEAIV